MWFNSMQRAEPYQGLTSREDPGNRGGPARGRGDRWCMVVVSSCREMLGSVPQRAQPSSAVASVETGTQRRLPETIRRKVGMTSNHHAPYALGHTRATMAGTARSHAARQSGSLKAGRSSDRRLQLACVKPELLVIADQHAAVNTFPGLVHTARHTTKVGNTPSRGSQPRKGRQPSKVGPMIGVKS
jgi:hypothetical protein